MAEEHMIDSGVRAVLRFGDGKVISVWLPGADVLTAITEVRGQVARGDVPVRVVIEQV